MFINRFTLTLLILVAATALHYRISTPEAVLERRSLHEFPTALGEWVAVKEQTIDRASMAILQVDDYFMRTYVNKKGQAIGLYIGYFSSQREGKGIHSPRQCLPGAGWTPLDARSYPLPISNHNPSSIEVDRYLMGKGDQRQVYIFWYQGRGRSYANEYMNKLYLILDAMTRHRTDGALVRVNMLVHPDADETQKNLEQFINEFYSMLSKYIPD
jgi:EpsI family protein